MPGKGCQGSSDVILFWEVVARPAIGKTGSFFSCSTKKFREEILKIGIQSRYQNIMIKSFHTERCHSDLFSEQARLPPPLLFSDAVKHIVFQFKFQISHPQKEDYFLEQVGNCCITGFEAEI